MKRNNKNRMAIALAFASIPFLMGCGKHDSPPPLPIVATVAPGYGVGGPGGACVPIGAQIPFAGQGIYFDSANIRGGLIPNYGQSIGQFMVGGGGGGGPFQRTAPDGTIAMNVIPVAASPYGQPGGYQQPGYQQPGYQQPGGYNPGVSQGPGQVSVTGLLMISGQTQQDIVYKLGLGGGGGYGAPGYGAQGYGGGGGYNPYGQPGAVPQPYGMQQGPCVSGIAMDLGHYNTLLYGGNVYVYMNNTAHGYSLYF